jgi:hypothetical protein
MMASCVAVLGKSVPIIVPMIIAAAGDERQYDGGVVKSRARKPRTPSMMPS